MKARSQKAASILTPIADTDLATVSGGNTIIIVVNPNPFPPRVCTGCGIGGSGGGLPKVQA